MYLKNLCKPRESVFIKDRRDVVLDLSDLLNDKITPEIFFDENYITDGMRLLLENVFSKFSAKKDIASVYILTQSMGGGKTHNMIALGLLAKYPHLRNNIFDTLGLQPFDKPIRVVGFNGRETDAPYGIWGAIAEQLKKLEQFKEYYQPLQAPGQTAWTNLLKGEPTIILLDELPPYLENAYSTSIGKSTLAEVTETALSNLFVAANKMDNVCIVMSALTANYERGNDVIDRIIRNLEAEINRSAQKIEPVSQQGNEVYEILKKRLFEKLPNEEKIKKIANLYRDAVTKAKDMNITNYNPDTYATRLLESYPFHFSIRDLYGRFKENSGFQQTRGLIRLMRTIVSDLYETDVASSIYLISPYDINLNNNDIYQEIKNINPSLNEALVKDVSNKGNATAEEIDREKNIKDAEDIAKLIYLSSLSDIPNAVQGLRIDEIIAFLCAPNRDISKSKDIIKQLLERSWYLYEMQDGRHLFKNVKNLMAQVHEIKGAYTKETAIKELVTYLNGIFEPKLKDCYQKLYILCPPDEIKLEIDKISLIITEPVSEKYEDINISKDYFEFYKDTQYKNRLMFLTGQKNTMDNVYEGIKTLKAINSIIGTMETERVSEKDPQMQDARNRCIRAELSLKSAIRETFTLLIYPSIRGLRQVDIRLEFTDNNFNTENLIKKTLVNEKKYIDENEEKNMDILIEKAEGRLFGSVKKLNWSEIKRKAATNPEWNFHRPDLLELIKEHALNTNKWIDDGGVIEKGPFPPPKTTLKWKVIDKDKSTGEATLYIFPINGDTVYYEYGDTIPTTASEKLQDWKNDHYVFKTKEMEVSFLCVDSTGKHNTGDPILWKNTINLKYGKKFIDNNWCLEIKALPTGDIYYTTDGSDPANGARYNGPFVISENCKIVSAMAKYKGQICAKESFQVDINNFKIDPNKQILWKHSFTNLIAGDYFSFIDRIKKYKVKLSDINLEITSNDGKQYIEYSASEELFLDGIEIDEVRRKLQQIFEKYGSQIKLTVNKLFFETGQDFNDFVADAKINLNPEEVIQDEPEKVY